MRKRLIFREEPNAHMIEILDNKSGTSFGEIVRYSAMKTVVFNPRHNRIYSEDILMEIVEKIKEVNKEIKEAYRI